MNGLKERLKKYFFSGDMFITPMKAEMISDKYLANKVNDEINNWGFNALSEAQRRFLNEFQRTV